MAKNLAPAHWMPSFQEDGTKIEVPIASFPELTAAEADGATGDIRKVAYAICDQLATAYAAEAPADRPNRMEIVKSQALNSAGQIVRTYSFTFILAPASIEVANEAA